MEKTPMYSVVSPPPHPGRRRWVAWAGLGVGLISLVVACVTAGIAVRQVDRVASLEETVLEMQLHMEQILQFTINSHDYLEYDDEIDDSQFGAYEELTVRGVVRKKRDADNQNDGVPIYEQAYGVDLKTPSTADRLRLYDSLFDPERTNTEVSAEASTESPIKPYHRISNLWVPKERRQRTHSPLSSRALVRSRDDDEDYEDEDSEVVFNNQVLTRSGGGRRTSVLKRPSRVKSLHGPGRRVRPRQKTRTQSNPSSVLFRESLVKATERHSSSSSSNFPGFNSVVPQASSLSQAPRVVDQNPESQRRNLVESVVHRPESHRFPGKDGKKKRPRKKQSRRRRRASSAITVAHFQASPANNTSHHGGPVHDEWTPAAWMDKLGLNRKYDLASGTVTVKEAGLYYLYSQVLYHPGRFGTGYQIVVDGIPIMECTMTQSQPSHSCHTSGVTYLPRNAAVYIRDLEHHMSAVKNDKNSFFGFVKLMDAPATAEQLILG